MHPHSFEEYRHGVLPSDVEQDQSLPDWQVQYLRPYQQYKYSYPI